MFALSEDTPFHTELLPWAQNAAGSKPDFVFQQVMGHTSPIRLGTVIRAGARAVFEETTIEPGSKGLIAYGAALEKISADGLGVRVTFESNDGVRLLFDQHLTHFDADSPWVEQTFDAPTGTGRFVVECDPGPQADPTADWLALYELVAAPREQFSLVRARTYPQWRTRNEIAVCSSTYEHDLYAVEPAEEVVAVPAQDVQDTYQYTVQQLESRVAKTAPSFRHRLHSAWSEFGQSRPMRILSLASGAARIEAMLVDGLPPGSFELTLVDINPGLLQKAARAFHVPVRTMVGNLNTIELPVNQYDVIVCVSALHHVVELEHLIASTADALVEGGEFWSIGEYVGRTGARLWPDAYEVANEFFSALPEKYRWNHTACASPRLDSKLPNGDCSVGTFEGIRSDEIEPILSEHFDAVAVDRRSCFLWRLFDPAYLSNFSVSREEDRALMDRAVELEYDFYMRGGAGVSLNGVYRVRSRRPA